MPAVFQVTQSYSVNGGVAQNVLHFQARGDALPNTQDVWTRWDAFFTTTWRSVISSQCLLLPIRVQRIDIEDGEVVLQAPTQARGSNAGAAAPSNLSIVVGWRSKSPSRRKNGRTYLAGFPSTFYDGNVISTVGQSGLSTMLATYITTFGPQGTDPLQAVIYSETTHKLTPGNIVPAITPVEQTRISAILRGQRRRQQDVGL